MRKLFLLAVVTAFFVSLGAAQVNAAEATTTPTTTPTTKPADAGH